MAVFYTNGEKETIKLAAEIAKKLKPGDVIAYHGGLGAGKTTFTRGLVEGLGIDADVSSPTFALINEYRGANISLYHFDMYRVFDFESLFSTGFFDYLDSGGILAIEWSENIEEELPEDIINITLETDPDNMDKRKITIEGGLF